MNKEIAWLILFALVLLSPLVKDEHVIVRLFKRWFLVLWVIGTISISRTLP